MGLAGHIHLDNKLTFRKKSHEKKFLFNEQVHDKLVDSVTAALDQTPPAVEKARSFMKEGEKLIDARQKNIKIADRSEHGWATVAEYELADNSDDEKRLFRADQRAGRKWKQKSAIDIRKRAPWSSPTSLSGVEHAPQSSGPTLMQNLISQLQGHSLRRNISTGADHS